MEEIAALFAAVPLPYEYLPIPDTSQPRAAKVPSLYYYVNRVITTLSQNAFLHAGISRSASADKWNFSWGRQYESGTYVKCKSWQKINHFAGAFLMGRKDDFHRRMTELKARIGTDASFYPESFLLPVEQEALEKVYTEHNIWITKPAAAARGNGIKLVSSEAPIPRVSAKLPVIYQVYIERPLLIEERKFDLRMYVLVTSLSPLRIYMHKTGMARFATHKYTEEVSLKDLKANLTNFSVNKDDKEFVACDSDEEKVSNSKWSLDFFLKFLSEQGVDTEALMKECERVTASTVIAGFSAIRNHHRKYIKHRHTSYELYGIDILLDENYKPYVMEINISPGMDGSESPLDRRIKKPLMNDTIKMARFVKCNCTHPDPCPGIDLVDNLWRTSVTAERTKAVMEDGTDPWENPVFADFVSVRDFMEEKAIKTDFRRVFPKRATMENLNRCFDTLEYRDFVFQQWIRKPRDERLAVLTRSFDAYKQAMAEISATAQELKEENDRQVAERRAKAKKCKP